VLRRIKRDSTAEKLVEQAKWLLFEEPEMTMRFHALKQIAMKERVVDKLKVFLWFALVPLPNDYDAVRLPPQLIGLYYAIHPLRAALMVALTDPKQSDRLMN
jgi:hypothetical protein